MSDIEKLNLVILPDKKSNKISIDLSKKLSEKFKTFFILDGVELYPHISLYHVLFPIKNHGKIVEKIKSLAENTKPFNISLNRVTFENFSKVLHWKCELTPELASLHKRLIEDINPLREGVYENYLKDCTEEEKKNIEKYGYIHALELYDPHITITRFDDREEIKSVLTQLPPSIERMFDVSKIHLGKLGDHGTVTEILEEFPLTEE